MTATGKVRWNDMKEEGAREVVTRERATELGRPGREGAITARDKRKERWRWVRKARWMFWERSDGGKMVRSDQGN
jgi:hypothetical protein